MCLINVAHEHLITQKGKKSKPALINFMGPGAEGPRAEGQEKQIPIHSNNPLKTYNIFRTISSINLLFIILVSV